MFGILDVGDYFVILILAGIFAGLVVWFVWYIKARREVRKGEPSPKR